MSEEKDENMEEEQELEEEELVEADESEKTSLEQENENEEEDKREDDIDVDISDDLDSEPDDNEASVENMEQDEEKGEDDLDAEVDEDSELTEEEEGELTEELEEEISEEEEAERLERQLRDFHRNQIEAALYAAGKPLSVEIIASKLELPKKEVEELITELAFDYLDRSTSLVIAQMGDRYQMQIKPEYSEKVSKFAEGGAIAEKYLRTLTIIALKQPIMKSLLIKIRGSGAYEHVKYLEENGLVDSKKKGRSSELFTTDKYAEMFGLPKDREAMKRMMVAQLGLDENAPAEPEPEEE